MASSNRRREVGAAAVASALAGGAQAADLAAVARLALSALALAALAHLLSRLAEAAGEGLGAAHAAFLQGLLGNLPELLVVAFSLAENKPLLAKYAVAGSLAANGLLVLGLCGVASQGGRPIPLPPLCGPGGFLLAAICAAAVLLYPPALHLSSGLQEGLSLAVAVALLAAFLGWQVAALAGRRPAVRASLPLLAGLVAVGLLTAAVSEWFVGAVYPAAGELGASRPFMGLIVVGIAANAVEHGSAVLLAARGARSLAGEVVAVSVLQVGGFLLPAAVLLAVPLGRPATLATDGAALASLLCALAVLPFARRGVGRATGAALLAAYIGLAAALQTAVR